MKQIKQTAKQTKDDIYVDNVITDTNNHDKALQLYKEAKEIFQDPSTNYVTRYPTQRLSTRTQVQTFR